MEKFEGATTALITPFDELGRIDWYSLEKLVEFQLYCGIHNLLLCGTTSQSPTLSWEEHSKINRRIIKLVNEKVPIIVGAGSNSTKEAAAATWEAYNEGADATLHVTGYYNWPSQEGIYRHFCEIADIAPIPLIMYDVPSRGHPLIEPSTRIRCAYDKGNIIGIKDATGNRNPLTGEMGVWQETRKIAKECGFDKHSFKIISGDDPNTYEMVTDPNVEAVGVISVLSNIFPRQVAQMMEYLFEGEFEKAKEISDTINKLKIGIKVKHEFKIGKTKYFIEEDTFKNPAVIQTAAYLLGMIESDYLRSPLVALSEFEDAVFQIGKTLYEIYEKHPEYFDDTKDFYNLKIDKLAEFKDF